MQWECACGFKNKQTNEVCGGTGLYGCKAPRPDGDEAGEQDSWSGGGFGAMRTQKTKQGSSPYGDGAGDHWWCACGFKNKASNDLCGGSGSLGCKSARWECDVTMMWSMMAGGGFGAMGGGDWGAMGGGGRKGGGAQTEWNCGQCGFKNRGSNTVCGGANGTLGCKAAREEAEASGENPLFGGSPSQVLLGNSSFQGALQQAPWTCGSCGFKNRPSNTVCGGVNGSLGCKADKSEAGESTPQSQWGGKRKATQEAWECGKCGFNNRPANDVCGGFGQMGCKAPRPDENGVQADVAETSQASWACPACGFNNRPKNEVCGGFGSMGCKAPKPDDL